MEEPQRKELIQFYHDAFASAIGSAAFEDITEIWNELAKLEPDNTASFIQMADELKSRKKNELACKLLVSLIQLYRASNNQAGQATVITQAAKLAPRDEQLKEEVAAFYRQTRGDHPLISEAIEKSGLANPATAVNEATAKLEMYLKFRPDDIVNHPTGWGMGRVQAVDLDAETLTVDFDARKNHTMSLEMASRILERLIPGGFKARKYLDPDSLKTMAESAPEELLKLLIREMGGKASLKDIKAKLVDGVLDTADWTRWWTVAKRAAMKDPYLNVSGGAAAAIELRDKPLSHQEEIIGKVKSAKVLDTKIALVDEYIGSLKSTEHLAEVLEQLAQMLLAEANQSRNSATVVQTALVIDDLRALSPQVKTQPPALDAILAPGTALSVVEDIPKPSHKRRALLRLKDIYPDRWADVFCSIFSESAGERSGRNDRSSRSDLWDVAAKELIDAKKLREITQAFAHILSKYKEYPEVYLWLCRSAITGKYPIILGEHNKIDLVEKLLNLLNELNRTVPGESKTAMAERKKLQSKAREAIAVSDFKYLQKIAADSSEDEGRRIYNAAKSCLGLTDTAYERILDIVIAEHPSVVPAKIESAEEDAILTTPDGLRRKEAEFDNVMNKEIPENQEALRVAISFGDLSENAEYSAAREQQGILMKKAERIKKELTVAKLIDPEAVRDDEVSIGCSIEIRNTRNDRIEHYTILGPWDSDAERGVVSYLTPMAEAFLGKKLGDKARLDFSESKDEYELVSIKKAI